MSDAYRRPTIKYNDKAKQIRSDDNKIITKFYLSTKNIQNVYEIRVENNKMHTYRSPLNLKT